MGVRREWGAFAVVPRTLARDPALSLSARALYTALASYADDQGTCFPGMEELALHLDMTSRSVRRARAELERRGYLQTERRYRDNGSETTPLYVLLDGGARRTPVSGGADTGARGGRTQVSTPEQDQPNKQTSSTSSPRSAPPDKNDTEGRREAGPICDLLAGQVEQLTGRRPTVTKRWLDAARLLVDADGRTPVQVKAAIAWVGADAFWATNVLSMPKLRQHYPRLQAEAQRRGSRVGHDRRPAPGAGRALDDLEEAT